MSGIECVRCGSRAQMYLCPRCTGRTRRALRDLAGLASHLAEAAVGQTRLSDIGRHTPYRSRHELDGEASLASQIESLPECDDLDEARRQREQNALRKLLAAGGVNERASSLHANIANMLTTWIRDLCEARGINWDGRGRVGDMCAWLHLHIDTIANHEAADEFCDELDEHLGHIRRLINRPEPPRFVGPCPAPHPELSGRACNLELRAHRKATRVTCTQCGTDHDIDEVGRQLLDGISDWWLGKDELFMTLHALGLPVTWAKLRKWRFRHQIRERVLPDGTPQYHLGDARTLAARGSIPGTPSVCGSHAKNTQEPATGAR